MLIGIAPARKGRGGEMGRERRKERGKRYGSRERSGSREDGRGGREGRKEESLYVKIKVFMYKAFNTNVFAFKSYTQTHTFADDFSQFFPEDPDF